MAPIERPDWGAGTALATVEADTAVAPAEAESTFAEPEVERRYRSFVASRMSKASLPPTEAREVLAPALAAEWDASGGFAARLAQAQRSAITILERLDPIGRADFIAAFDGLPEAIRTTLFSEISLGSSGSVRQASDVDVARFASTSEGRDLVDEWGPRARRHVAIVRDRIGRILKRMSAEEAEAATEWFETLPPAAAASVYRMLVAK